MVFTHLKAVVRRTVATKTELPHKHTAVQLFGYKECLSLTLIPEGGRDKSCFLCDRVNDLLSLVVELKEEVKGQRVSGSARRRSICGAPPCHP